MKKYLLFLGAALLALLNSSCFEHTATIRLEKDGSGTITEETTVGDKVLQVVAQMPMNPIAGLTDKEVVGKYAAKLGDGVTVEKIEPAEGGKGGKVTYHFKDINKLKYAYGKSLAMAASMNPEDEEAQAGEPTTFTYADGKLTMKMPNPKPDPEKEKQKAAMADQLQPAQVAEIKDGLKDAKMSFKLIVAPGIDKSTATNVEGDTVTLLNMEFNKLIADDEKFLKFVKSNPETPADMQKVVAGVDGIKMETKEEITVDVK